MLKYDILYELRNVELASPSTRHIMLRLGDSENNRSTTIWIIVGEPQAHPTFRIAMLRSFAVVHALAANASPSSSNGCKYLALEIWRHTHTLETGCTNPMRPTPVLLIVLSRRFGSTHGPSSVGSAARDLL
jgi:hypothetical protein